MGWTIDALTEWDEIEAPAAVARWRGAIERTGTRATPFAHPAIIAAYLDVAGRDTFAPLFVLARHDDGREAMALLGRRMAGLPSRLGRVYAYLGTEVFDYTEPLVTAGNAGTPAGLDAAFWAALEKAVLGSARADFLALPRVREQNLGGAQARRHSAVPVIQIARHADAEAFIESRSSKMRATLRRARRGIEREGRYGVTVHGPGDVDAVLAWLPRFLATREARHEESSHPLDPAAFFPALVRRGLPLGIVHASTLTLDGEPFSWEINLWWDGVLHGYSCAFDPAFRRFSPGSLHKLALIDWLCANGGRTYDFMRGGEMYKNRWTDGEEWPVAAFERRSDSLASRARLRASERLSRLARRIPGLGAAGPGRSGAAATNSAS